MGPESAGTPTTLTANAFEGWNSVANRTGTSYTDGANHSFSASTILYARWTNVRMSLRETLAEGIELARPPRKCRSRLT